MVLFVHNLRYCVLLSLLLYLGNLPTVTFLLSQMNERDKKQLIGLSDSYRYTHITHAIDGGEIEVMNIYCTIDNS